MQNWIENYVESQKKALDSISKGQVEECIKEIRNTKYSGNKIFVFGNGGSASNCSHFATDLGKSSSDAVGSRFNVTSLNDNVSWITAIGNDYCYEDIYKRQLENYVSNGDLIITLSVSGNSPNLIRACEWAKKKGCKIMAFIGGKKGKLLEIATHPIVVDTQHYGRAEDCQMTICHMLCYAFVELEELK